MRFQLSRAPACVVFAACVACCSHAVSDEPAPVSKDETAIRERARSYLQAIERGDGEEMAAFWTAEGDYVDEAGQRFNGRRLARQHQPRSSEEANARELTADAESIRFVTPDVAIEDGAVNVVKGPAEKVVVKRYSAIWVRRKGGWMLDGVRELAAPAAASRGPLDDLEWLIGDWASEAGGEQSIRLACRWSDDKHFLLAEADLNHTQRGPMHVTQRIGWDARERQIKSWAFDSAGGHGQGLWFRKGDGWIVEAEIVLADGSRATSTNLYIPDGDEAFEWKVTNSELNGEPKPDRSVRMIRQKASSDQ